MQHADGFRVAKHADCCFDMAFRCANHRVSHPISDLAALFPLVGIPSMHRIERTIGLSVHRQKRLSAGPPHGRGPRTTNFGLELPAGFTSGARRAELLVIPAIGGVHLPWPDSLRPYATGWSLASPRFLISSLLALFHLASGMAALDDLRMLHHLAGALVLHRLAVATPADTRTLGP